MALQGAPHELAQLPLAPVIPCSASSVLPAPAQAPSSTRAADGSTFQPCRPGQAKGQGRAFEARHASRGIDGTKRHEQRRGATSNHSVCSFLTNAHPPSVLSLQYSLTRSRR